MLPRGPHDSPTFPTATGKARFTVNPPDAAEVPDGHLLLQTVRSHDQFNTTVYGLDDCYRGIKGGRRVIFVNTDDLRGQGLSDGDSSTSSACGQRASGAARASGPRATRRRRGAQPRTFPRRTYWYHSTPRQRSAIR